MGYSRVFRLLLAALLPALLLTSVVATYLPVANASSNLSIRYYVITLPNEPPKDPKVADAVIDLLITVNKESVKNPLIKYYLTLTSTYVSGEYVPKGSLVVATPSNVPKGIIKAVKECGSAAKLLGPFKEFPPIPAIVIKPPKIALFDNGALDEISLPDVLKEMGFKYDVVSNSSITDLLTKGYRILILPPGSGTATARKLGPGGSKVVAEFLVRGGNLIGICAGAYAVIEGYNKPTTWLQLVDARLRNWPTWWLGTGIVLINITGDTPVTFGFKGVSKFIYWNGPVLEPTDLGKNTTLGIDVEPPTPIAKFLGPSNAEGAFSPGWGDLNLTYVTKVMRGGYAVTYSTYGLGKVLLFSVHPELTRGDLSYAPNSKLPSKYNWRMLWNAIYFLGGERVVIGGAVVGTWMWPSLLKYAYQSLLKARYGNKEVTYEEKLRVLRDALDYLARELRSYGITDVFLEVKLLSGKVIWPSDVAKKYGVPTIAGKNGLEPYNLTNIVKEFANALHRYGIRLHAWIIVWYDRFWGAKDPMWHCSKWVSKSKFVKEYKVTSRVRLFDEEYRRYLSDLVKELIIKCGVDGIHLDYIRWPHIVYSFGPKDYELAASKGINLSKVEELVILTFYGDPSKGIPPQPGLIFKKYYIEKDPDVVKWFELRREAVVAILKDVKKAAEEAGKEVSKEVILSAAVMPEEGERGIKLCRTDLVTGKEYCAVIPGKAWQWCHYGQRYSDFVKLGYWLIPMAYHRAWGKPPSWVGDVVKYVRGVINEVNPQDRVLAGVQAYGGVTLNEVKSAVNYGLDGGASGWVYFVWNLFRDTAWSSLITEYSSKLRIEKEVILGPTYLESLLLSNASALKEVLKLGSELSVAGSEYFKPNPKYLVLSTEKVILPIVKSLSKELVTRLASLSNLVNSLGPTYRGYYAYVLSKASLYLVPVLKASSIEVLEDPLSKLVALATSGILTIETSVKVSSLTSKVSALSNEVASLKESLSSLGSDVKELTSRVSEVSNAVAGVESRLGDLTKLSDEVSEMSNSLSNINNYLTGVDAKVKELSSKVSTLGSSIVKVENEVSKVKEDLLKVSQDLSKVKESVSKLSSEVKKPVPQSPLATAALVMAIISLIASLVVIGVVTKRRV